jgi:chitinase
MAANETSRLNFARNCRDLIVEYDFDGIDIDWEYPGYADHGGTPGDTENFNLLLGDVRAALDDLGAETGRTYGLTAALPCGPSNVENVDVGAVSGYLSELNLMTYGACVCFRSFAFPPPIPPRRRPPPERCVRVSSFASIEIGDE